MNCGWENRLSSLLTIIWPREDFQAKATYQSVIDNSPLQEVVDEAELKLMVLQEEIQKQSEITQDTLEIEEIENR